MLGENEQVREIDGPVVVGVAGGVTAAGFPEVLRQHEQVAEIDDAVAGEIAEDGQVRERFDLVDAALRERGAEYAGVGQVGDEEGVVGGQESVGVTDAGLAVLDEMEIFSGLRIGVDERVFAVGGADRIELAVEPRRTRRCSIRSGIWAAQT